MQHLRKRAVSAILAAILAAGGTLASLPARAGNVLRIGGTGAALGLVRNLGTAFEKRHRGVKVYVPPSMGSSGGIKAVLQDALDIGLSSRRLQPEEGQRGLSAREFARTPFVLAAGIDRRGAGFSLADVAAIYAGDITTWPDDSRIRLVLRPRSDADIAIIESLSPALSASVEMALERRGMLQAATDQENCDLLTEVPGALGFTTLTQIITEDRDLATLSLDGVMPASGHDVNPAYPHLKHLYAVTRSKPSPAVVQFLSFLRSSAARRIIREGGAIPVIEDAEPAP